MNFHSLEIEKILNILETNFYGLAKKEAERRILKYGKNYLPEEETPSALEIFLKQFKNIFNSVLFFAFFLSLIVGKVNDSVVIVFIILVNAFLGFYFELRTYKKLNELRKLLQPETKVLRDGQIYKVSTEEIVPGDVVILEEGDLIPADVRFFEVDNLKVDESMITGESLPVEKDIKILPEDTPVQSRLNFGYFGTFVTEGKGKAVVCLTGVNTYLGTIYEKYKKIKNLAPHFEYLSKNLIIRMFLIAVFTSLIILYFSFKKDYTWTESLFFVLAAFISSIPEGLPVIITVLLVSSAYYLYKRNVLVKNMQATENLSVVNLLLTDKTGTLTENFMTARKIFLYPDEEIEVTGDSNLENVSYNQKAEDDYFKGIFLKDNKEINIFENYPLVKLLNIITVVNEAEIILNNTLEIKGNPRDVALIILSRKAGFKKDKILEIEKILKREPFSRVKKYKRVVVKHERVESYYVGAFEKLIESCEFVLTKDGEEKFVDKDKVLNKAIEYSNMGFSVLAVAFNVGDKEENQILVGLIALYDPPKKETKETILNLKEAGIDVKILTGDHKSTAVYVAKEVGFDNLNALDEREFLSLNEDEVLNKLREVSIFARVTPEIKLKILSLYQKLGYQVAYIGDGVNDILSLKQAEVGVAMGKRGSEVAKEASDIILVDDNINSLVDSFLEGRKIFNNLKRVVFFLVTTNVAESLTIISSLVLNLPFILKPTHILFLNFVTDTLVGTTLIFEKEHGYEMKTSPRDKKESLINLSVLPFLLIMSSSMALLTVLIFSSEYKIDLEKARTYAFLLMSLTQIFNVLNLRSFKNSLFVTSFRLNPYLVLGLIFSLFLQVFIIFTPAVSKFLGFSQISLFEFIYFVLLSSSVFIVGEIYKYFKRKIF